MAQDEERGWVAAGGDTLCLDFANTRSWRGSPDPAEGLKDIEDLLAWCEATATAPAGAVAALAERWHRSPEEGQAVLEGAITLRETIYRIFVAVADGGVEPRAELDILNQALAAAPSRRELVPLPTGFGWRIAVPVPSALACLAPVLWSAADLLVGPRRQRIRYCANEACRWLFLDDSKSGNRRWCSMSACGNRAKAHRHYLKKKEAS